MLISWVCRWTPDWIPWARRKRGRPKKTWVIGVQAPMTTRNLEPDQWRNREEWRLVSGRRRQLLKNRTERSLHLRLGLKNGFFSARFATAVYSPYFFVLKSVCEIYVQYLYTFLISLKRAAGLLHFFLIILTLCLLLLFQATQWVATPFGDVKSREGMWAVLNVFWRQRCKQTRAFQIRCKPSQAVCRRSVSFIAMFRVSLTMWTCLTSVRTKYMRLRFWTILNSDVCSKSSYSSFSRGRQINLALVRR